MPLEYTLLPDGTISTLGDAGLFLLDTYGQLVDLSSGYTFTVYVFDGDDATIFTKSTSITGAAGSLTSDPPVPNITIAWHKTVGELQLLTTRGTYKAMCVATRGSDSGKRVHDFTIVIS